MKNIIYKHLKTCVLSLCVAVSCGDKAFGEPGVYFRCDPCTTKEKSDVWIKETDWIEHQQKEHKYTGKFGVIKLAVPGAFLCGQCKDEDEEITFSNLEELIAHLGTHESGQKYGIKCLNCRREFPWCFKDTHNIFHLCYSKMSRIAYGKPTIAFYCKACKWHIRKDGWNKHVHKAHGGDFSENIFVCPKCKEHQHQKSGQEVGCQKCGHENSAHCIKHKCTFEKDNWNVHVDYYHKGNFCGKFWYCAKCDNLRYQEWKGILCCQKCQYMYCQSHNEEFYGEKWNEHLKEKHKKDMDSVWFCTKCKVFARGDSCEKCASAGKSLSGFCQICKELVEDLAEHKKEKEHSSVLWEEKNGWRCLGCESVLAKKEGDYCENCKSQIWCQHCKKAIGVYSWNAHRKENHKNDTSNSVFVCCDEIYDTWWGTCCLKCNHMYCLPCKEMIVRRAWNDHVKQAHKGDFSSTVYVCPVCLHGMKLQNREGHIREKHPDVLSYCEFCSIVFGKNKIQDMRNHMAYEHPDVLYCEVCSIVFEKNKIQDRKDHMIKNHSDVYCEICDKVFEKDKKKDHMIENHSDVYCEICHEVVGKNKGEKIEHWNVNHKDCFFCRLCHGSFKDRAEHIKNVHPGARFCACGVLLLPYEVGESWHIAKHSVHCPLCKKAQPQSHMVTAHECKEGVCKPIASTEELTWKWQCDPSCKNLIKPCPFEKILGCQFTGSAEQLTVHMWEKHKCEKTCGFNESGDFVHGAFCRNGPAYCSLCKGNVENREPHWRMVHKCVEGCLIAIGEKGKWHQADCRDWTLSRCPECQEQDVDRKHIFKHFPTCVKNGCYLIQDNSENGCVFIRHQGHSNEKQEFALQDYGEEDVIESEPEEDYIDDLEGDQGE